MVVEVVTMVTTVNTHPHNHYSHWNLLTTIKTHLTVMVVAMILLYTSPFNPQNHLMAVEVGKMVRTTHYNHQNRLGGDGCSDGFQIHISMQPSESSGGWGVV
jgi:hypothetical protein